MEKKNEVKPSTVNERVLSGSFSFDTLPDNPEIEIKIAEFVSEEQLKEEIKEISLRKPGNAVVEIEIAEFVSKQLLEEEIKEISLRKQIS